MKSDVFEDTHLGVFDFFFFHDVEIFWLVSLWVRFNVWAADLHIYTTLRYADLS